MAQPTYNYNLHMPLKITSNLNIFTVASFVGPILLFLLLLAGSPLFEAIKLTFVLLVQISAGVFCWNFLFPMKQNDIMLTIGAGSTVGVCISTLIHQILLNTPLSSVAWLLPFVFFLVLAQVQGTLETAITIDHELPKMSLFLILVSFTIVGLLDQWWWLTPVFLVTVIAYFFINRAIQRTGIAEFSTGQIFLLISFLFAIPISISLRKLNTLWWIISNDSVFFESLSFSINKWGKSADISALGESVMYHWFSFAWAGMTTEISGASSWTVLTLMLPIICCVMISSITWSLFIDMTGSRLAAGVACSMLLSVRNIISPTSPSQLLSIAIVLTILSVSKHSLTNIQNNLGRAMLFLFLVFVLFGTKISSGAVYLGGIVVAGVVLNSIAYRAKFLLIFSAIFTAFFSYRFFFGKAEGSINPRISLDDLGGSLLFGRAIGGGRFHLVFDLIALSIVFAPCFAVLSIAFFMRHEISQNFLLLSLTSALFLGVGAATLIDANGTQAYFLHSAFVSAIFLIVLFPTMLLNKESGLPILILVKVSIVAGLMIGFFSPVVGRFLKAKNSNSLLLSASPQFSALAICMLMGLIFAYRSRNGIEMRVCFTLLFALSMMASVIGENLNNRVWFARSLFSLEGERKEQFSDFNYFAGSPDRVQALTWLKHNSPEDAVVATNRKCLTTTFCGPEKWFLASAISHRQMLIEGYFYSVGVTPKPFWAEKRIEVSERFVDGPKSPDSSFATSDSLERFAITTKKQDYEYLKMNNVGFVIVDLEFIYSYVRNDWETSDAAQLKSWEPYATTVFKNEEMAILKMN